jgi:hypothetical protein
MESKTQFYKSFILESIDPLFWTLSRTLDSLRITVIKIMEFEAVCISDFGQYAFTVLLKFFLWCVAVLGGSSIPEEQVHQLQYSHGHKVLNSLLINPLPHHLNSLYVNSRPLNLVYLKCDRDIKFYSSVTAKG